MDKIIRAVISVAVVLALFSLWNTAPAAAGKRDLVTPVDTRISSFDTFNPSLTHPRQKPDTSICLGERVTDIVEAGEMWSGGEGNEVVVVLSTGSVVSGNGGDDRICIYDSVVQEGYSGSQIFGGQGNDTIITYGGNNNIDSGEGNDLIYLNGGDESVTTLEGDDHIWGLGAQRITAYGGSGNDLVVGSHGDDYINSGSDDDVVLGNGGNDEIVELYGSNKLYGSSGTDTIYGGADYDLCHDFDQDTTFMYCEDIVQPPGPPLPEASN